MYSSSSLTAMCNLPAIKFNATLLGLLLNGGMERNFSVAVVRLEATAFFI